MATGNKISKQMKNYITGPYAKQTDKMILDSVSAPNHNMFAEKTLGTLDALKAGAPNATLAFLEPKVRAQMNQTLEWLDVKDLFEQKNYGSVLCREGTVSEKDERGEK